ncbi:hypothetical protein FNU76_09280 [Chitinimonas arctica]|uniref:Uncharacterized protein n=1 Tax=Chitinimonas arctica TaxID=2594795 RepID=A0A516SEG7_9NEIS|nr:hypothetical protein [Chitinimonas arctica]QDQ26546.1 hypothetical protein FNU76_09280 [Chitinimonas arctica]
MPCTTLRTYARAFESPAELHIAAGRCENSTARKIVKGIVGIITLGIGYGVIKLYEYSKSRDKIHEFCDNAMLIHDALNDAYKSNDSVARIRLNGKEITFTQVGANIAITDGENKEKLKGIDFRGVCKKILDDVSRAPGPYVNFSGSINEKRALGSIGILSLGIDYGAIWLCSESAGMTKAQKDVFCEYALSIHKDLYLAACNEKSRVEISLANHEKITFTEVNGGVMVKSSEGKKIGLKGASFESICKKLSAGFLEKDLSTGRPSECHGLFIGQEELYGENCEKRNEYMGRFVEVNRCFAESLDDTIEKFKLDVPRTALEIEGVIKDTFEYFRSLSEAEQGNALGEVAGPASDVLAVCLDQQCSPPAAMEKREVDKDAGKYCIDLISDKGKFKTEDILTKILEKCPCITDYQLRMLMILACQAGMTILLDAGSYVDERFATVASDDGITYSVKVKVRADGRIFVATSYENRIRDGEEYKLQEAAKNNLSRTLQAEASYIIGPESVECTSSKFYREAPPPLAPFVRSLDLIA